MARRPRSPDRLGRILERTLEGRRLASVLVEADIAARWAEAVGAQVAARARPEALKDGVLVVRVASSPWLTELTFRKPRLLERINAVAGAPADAPVVTDLRLVAGPLPAQAPRPAPPTPAPLTPEQGRLVDAITRDCPDPTLRESIARALVRALGRGPLDPDSRG